MKHAVLPFLIATLMSVSFHTPAIGQGSVRVFVDGDPVTFDQPPIVVGSRVLIPLRGVFEQMGATVEWDAASRTVLAARGTTLVELRIGSRIAKVNERPVTLDVPPMIVRGRTLVPLRFISESLGATVDYRAESRTVLIYTGQAGPPQPPSAPGQTIRGIVTSVTLPRSTSEQPRIVVESGNLAYRVTVTVETAITRIELGTGLGGSVGVAALRPGDDAEVTLRDSVATRVRATYQMTSGKIDALARAGRTIILTDGRTIRYVPEVAVLLNGQPAQGGSDALRVGQVVEMRLNPTSKEAWEVNIISGAATVPPPEQMFLRISAPAPDETVSNPVAVRGTTVAGSRVEIVITWVMGLQVGRQVVTAGDHGQFSTRVPVSVVAQNSSYLITVTATNRDLGREQQQFTVVIR